MNSNQLENNKAAVIEILIEEQLDLQSTKAIIRKTNYQIESKNSAKKSHLKELSDMHNCLEKLFLSFNSDTTQEKLENASIELIKTNVMHKCFKGGLGIIEKSK